MFICIFLLYYSHNPLLSHLLCGTAGYLGCLTVCLPVCWLTRFLVCVFNPEHPICRLSVCLSTSYPFNLFVDWLPCLMVTWFSCLSEGNLIFLSVCQQLILSEGYSFFLVCWQVILFLVCLFVRPFVGKLSCLLACLYDGCFYWAVAATLSKC